jgi:hypothetical protein
MLNPKTGLGHPSPVFLCLPTPPFPKLPGVPSLLQPPEFSIISQTVSHRTVPPCLITGRTMVQGDGHERIMDDPIAEFPAAR